MTKRATALMPIQPKDRTDELYRLVSEYLVPGDQQRIAKKLGITDGHVSNVATGRFRSQKVWAELIAVVSKRRAEKVEWTNYMKAS